MKIYSLSELREILTILHGWKLSGDVIQREFKFKDFKEALAFIVQVGILSEKADHHPEIYNVYNQVILKLNTHSEKAITSKDIELATQINLLH